MRARVLTALALIPPVLAAVFNTSPWFVGVLLALVAIVGILELVRITSQVMVAIGAPFVLLAALVTGPTHQLGITQLAPGWQAHYAFGGAFVCLLAVISLALLKQSPKAQIHALIGGGWVIGPLVAAFALHQSGGYDHAWHLPNPILMAILPLWAGDTAAIFVGKAVGKRLLAPKISPKKTVEGSLANLAACILAAWGFGAWIGVPLPQSLACGLAAGTLGQAGDLFESWLKRRADLKDSGTILPGHGGVLDRIDSILFTAPAVAIILLYWR